MPTDHTAPKNEDEGRGVTDSADLTGRPTLQGRVRTALVAESDRALRELLRVHLQNAGYNVILAADAMVAGRTIVERPDAIDVLLINAQLPFMSGIEFVSTLIADSSLRFIPTILIATSEHEARQVDALNVPSLVAPFSAEQLLDLIRSTVEHPDGERGAAERAPVSMRQRLDDLTVPIAARRAGRPLRVILADDEPDTVASLMAIISHEGHSVFGTHHAYEVVPEVRTNKPDAVILDIDMPGISGFALAREIREMFGNTAPLLIAVSGKWVGQTDKMLAQLAGFDFFMQKPCHPDALLALLERRQLPLQAGRSEALCEPSLTSPT
jgi:DNA-binding response OmpR family regulator